MKKTNKRKAGKKMKTVEEIFDLLPLSERILLKYWKNGIYTSLKTGCKISLSNDGGHPCEWMLKDDNGNDFGMVKYYKGRKLCCFALKLSNRPEHSWQTQERQVKNGL